MKFIYLILVLFYISFTTTTYSQIKSNSFVRVFDAQGNKIGKGKIISHDDNSLTLKKGKDSQRLALNDIGSIRTKRSVGNNFAKGAVVGAGVGLIFAIGNSSSGDGFLEEEGYSTGIPMLAAIGAGIGGIAAIFKESNHFIVDGDSQKWEQFRGMIETEE